MGFFNGAFGYPLFNIGFVSANPTNPAGTASLSLIMAGLGIYYKPVRTGRVLIISSMVADTTTASGGIACILRSGTGNAPVNGAASTGTSIGAGVSQSSLAITTETITLNGIIQNLSIGTEYWFDIAFSSLTTGTTSLADITYTVMEI